MPQSLTNYREAVLLNLDLFTFYMLCDLEHLWYPVLPLFPKIVPAPFFSKSIAANLLDQFLGAFPIKTSGIDRNSGAR
jgi:hypothetical protein